MEQNSNYITFEMNFKFQMKDYRILLGLKNTWIIAAVVAAIQIIAWTLKNFS